MAVYLLLTMNWALWAELVRIGARPSVYGASVLGMALLLGSGVLALLALTAGSRWMKPLWILLLWLAAVVQYYMLSYRMVMDPSMVANVLHTDPAEARDLLSGRLILWVLVLALPATLWLWQVPIEAEATRTRLWRNGLLVLLALGVALLTVLALSRTLAPLMRNHVHLRYMMNPLASVYSGATVALRPLFARSRTLLPIHAGAALGASYSGQQRPPLLVLVVGETARADHFGLNGYARDTTPKLAARRVLSFGHVRSCGTNTLASVPCMFSHLGKAGFEARANEYENLLDVLQAAGLAVLWVDNQSGCKGVCDRVPHAQANDAAQAAAYPHWCPGGECVDEVMLEGLDQRLAGLSAERRAKGTVLVLHQMGSHGPAYAKRSTAALKRFAPECQTNTLADCSAAELVNAYDNSIAYTDHFLARLVDWLQVRSTQYDTGLLYVSDHGESLGEYGLFLHGLPYRLAPDAQTHVPMLTWLDGGLGRRQGIDMGCLRASASATLSHDNLYPTVLGMLDVASPTYQPALDAFAPCRARG